MNLKEVLRNTIKEAVKSTYEVELPEVEFQPTRKDFEGDITVVVFPMLRYVKGNPVQIGQQIGTYLEKTVDAVSSFNVVKGFLNIVIDDSFYLDFFNGIKDRADYGYVTNASSEAILVEYSSPNTNKPLHLGHIRNILLGYSVAEILKASGKKVYKTQIVNDRGIHICKSMLAWQRFAPIGNDDKRETPNTTLNPHLTKGDKFVGYYYVQYNKEYKRQLKKISENAQIEFKELVEEAKISGKWDFINHENPNLLRLQKAFQSAMTEYLSVELDMNPSELKTKDNYISDFTLTENSKQDQEILELKSRFRGISKKFNFIEGNIKNLSNKEEKKIIQICLKHIEQVVEIFESAKEMLRKWEAGNTEVVALWKKMNQWVYDGFDVTYNNLGVDFDKLYYESDTYLLGKDVVADGLEKGIFYKKDDGSVWIDLTDEGLDEKIVLRSDGTAVYMTQDIGTAIQRAKDYTDIGGMVYTVGNEQDYHFKVLFLILKKLGFSWADSLYHLSYGMVDLPSGKMKSREGTVVDADDLMEDMTTTAANISEELGKLEGYSETEKLGLYQMIGLGALKYYILKVDPKKRILFNPEESVDFQGNTGPFIQYTYARIQSILRKAEAGEQEFDIESLKSLRLHEKEKELIKQLQLFPETIQLAAENYSPALLANYTYDLVKEFNSFYQQVSILGELNQDKKVLRVQLSKKVGEVVQSAFKLLGIEVPDRM
ncbi:arginine--tRNA ligase [Kriegella aquimaris]|uniref:Arginine--tRNA ligase n=1 Tax=Kriegella aquimaris TaxID=192904 RepID=A0A1G9VZT6_9FLAO|nr:arginine--tRNA ligase [Kriegella aquimaris]SDM77734.1 arginyl-tRNA synthetase [Kriegella aquimaris]